MICDPFRLVALALLATACGTDDAAKSGFACGEGTHPIEGECVPISDTAAPSTNDDTGDGGDGGDSGPAIAVDEDGDGFTSPADCDDTDGTVHPDARETCDGIDNDCDGQTDEADAINKGIYYTDADGDGFGDATLPQHACDAPDGTVLDATDCDDADASRFPGAEEIWYDGIDNDCAGGSDDDQDGDGYPGNAAGTGEDCADTDDAIHPGATEICGDGIDNDCDGDGDGDDCRLSGEVPGDLANARLMGPGHDVWSGQSVAVSSDVTGDGIADVLIGAPRDDEGEINAGAVYVVAGPVSGLSGVDEAGIRLKGTVFGEMAGSYVTAGDVNGDGIDDVIVGSPLAHATYTTVTTGDTGDTGDLVSTTEVERAGSLSIVYGPIESRKKLSNADVHLFGWEVDHGLGQTASVLGDQNEDGHAELMVGLPGDDGSASNAGCVRIVSGPITAESDVSEGYFLAGDTEGDAAGTVVVNAGDLNGDGIDDVAVSAPLYDPAPPGDAAVAVDGGAVYVVLGPLVRHRFLGDSDGQHLGEYAADHAGTTLAAGDLNADGTSDLVVGAPGADGAHSNTGKVYIVSGPATTRGPLSLADTQIIHDEPDAQIGSSIALGGDVDGDAQTDLLVGTAWTSASAGRVWLLHGPLSGTHALSEAEASFSGTATNQRLGTSIAGGADLSGDGLHDIVIGAPGEDTVGDGAGATLIFFGAGS